MYRHRQTSARYGSTGKREWKRNITAIRRNSWLPDRVKLKSDDHTTHKKSTLYAAGAF
ncbi:hypothetical protein HII30_02430 [Paenibacillus lemnae]|uniref:Uncharacterized protein n=1 Tax=Paenibacillus lemnae TaxID=1330551 RepID=A0A848M1L2_PAELE|nr:hypothetical protein [Paenibacillus lemnae]